MINFDINDIQKKIGYKFKNWELLFNAFTHTSYANENFVSSYERLEFLGDSVLNFVAANYFFRRYQKEGEGFLTKARARVVSKNTLSEIVRALDLLKYLRTSGGVIESEVYSSNSVRADLFESITGAIFLDGGMKAAEKFILKVLRKNIDADISGDNLTDYKSRLLEYAAKKGKNVEFKFHHDAQEKTYAVTVCVDGKPLGRGLSHSKKRAEQTAAQETMMEIMEIIE